jgi:hypothetical protein
MSSSNSSRITCRGRLIRMVVSHCLKRVKIVMIKFVLQAIPTYFISIFLVPSSLGDGIEKKYHDFFLVGATEEA